MTIKDELMRYDGVGLAELIRRGEVHPTELVEAAFDRIDQCNIRLNAVVERYYDEALERSKAPLSGPLAGVPTLLKDMIAYEGHRTAMGSRLLQDFIAPTSHEVVQRMERAGLIFLGRTNAPELGLLPTTEPLLNGPTHNPWDLSRSPGGSSGGSAVAVATAMVPLAHGNDGGGSIRIPSSACGVFGLKPSRGRTPQDAADEPSGIVNEHGLTRTVRDSAALLDAIAGPRPGDRWWAPPPERPYLEEVARDPGPLRIAFTAGSFTNNPVHPDCSTAVRDAARLCQELGHTVEEGRPAIDAEAFTDAYITLWCTIPGGLLSAVAAYFGAGRLSGAVVRRLGPLRTIKLLSRLQQLRTGHSMLEPWTWSLAQREAQLTPGAMWQSWNTLRKASYVVAELFERYDVLMTPVLGHPPVKTGELGPQLSFDHMRERLLPYVQFTPLCNSAGLPAMSVPLHQGAGGLPIGVHFIGRFGDEATLLRLAAQLERARPWADRWPPGFAPAA